MSEETGAAPAAEAAPPKSPKKAGAGKAKAKDASKKPKAKPSHPKTSDMVTAAIKNLKERNGSSLQAIKKYIAANYKVDAEKMAPFIRKYLKAAVTSGSLVQTKGKGASGSFKMATAGEKKPSGASAKKGKPTVGTGAPAKMKKAKAAEAKKAKEAKSKKPAAAKKAAAAAAAAAAASPKKAAAKPKTAKAAGGSATKAKKAGKSPTKKPKAPKPKKVAAKPKSPKKAGGKKK